jgi:hypothetical protein
MGRIGLRIHGRRRGRVRLRLSLVERPNRHRRLSAPLPGQTLRLNGRGRGSIKLALSSLARDRLRSALARCDRLALTVRIAAGGRHRRQSLRLRTGSCRASKRQLARLIKTPGGGYGPRAHGRLGGHAARFRVGAATASFSPPAAGHASGDTSTCAGAAGFTGPRAFAFTEPYVDVQHLGHYTPGDPYLDCDGNGRWEGNLLGGGSSTPRYFTRVADPVGARAMVVSNGRRTIAVEVVDQEGLFNIYGQQIRAKVAAAGVHLDNVFISANHDESAPDSLGLGGVNPAISGVNNYWVRYMVTQSAKAIVSAYRAMRPARIRYTETLEPRNLRQCWSSYPFVDDQHIPILQAVDRRGRTIVTLASVSQHAETLGFNSGTPTLDAQNDWVSSDWINFFRDSIQHRLGGVAVEMAGAVGSNESPEVYSGPIARTPEREIDATHPAGCRTEFETPHGPDVAGTGHVALGYEGETRAFGADMASAVIDALRSRSVYASRSNTIWGTRMSVCIPLTNLLFTAASAAGVFANRPGYNPGCTHQYPVTLNGTTLGTSLLSQVASFQVGDGQFISVPGEVFPFTYLGSFLGPQDMPDATAPMTPMLMPRLGTRFRFIDGLGEDMLGYIFPPGNAVGIPTAQNPGALNSDTDRFGCNHSDDAESTGAQTGAILGSAFIRLLGAHDRTPQRQTGGRYVLPDGTLSRDPLGGPESLQCNANQVFHTDGPAVGVELPGGRVVHPLAWMSLSGLPQVHPDRDTRGYFDSRGRRMWLNVFPNVSLP